MEVVEVVVVVVVEFEDFVWMKMKTRMKMMAIDY